MNILATSLDVLDAQSRTERAALDLAAYLNVALDYGTAQIPDYMRPQLDAYREARAAWLDKAAEVSA